MTHKLGAHLSISGGYEKPLHSIVEKGGNALQIFSASPRGWNFAQVDDETANSFIKVKNELGIDPVYFHASYLLNLGSNERIGQLSRQLLAHELNIAPRMQVKGSIIHLGSFKEKEEDGLPFAPESKQEKYDILIENIKTVLEKSSQESLFMIENAGCRKIGKSLEEIAYIIKAVDNPRVRVCLDTCHLHAAAYDLRTPEKFEEFITTFDKTIGLDKLEVIHMNDSKDPFGSLRDRHENIGEGDVGINVFKFLLNDPRTKDKAFIIETPGFDDKGPDKQNLDIVKGLINNN